MCPVLCYGPSMYPVLCYGPSLHLVSMFVGCTKFGPQLGKFPTNHEKGSRAKQNLISSPEKPNEISWLSSANFVVNAKPKKIVKCFQYFRDALNIPWSMVIALFKEVS